MIQMYCRRNHGSTGELCSQCVWLHDYALERLDKCPCGEKKSTCANCPIHCYKPDMRWQVTEVMRFSGPRMLFSHPTLALGHLVDGLRDRKKDSE